MQTSTHRVRGFTLIELLIVITIIATLLVVVFAALNPAQRLKQARDAKRVSDVDSILTAIHEYIIDNSGGTPGSLSSTEQQLGTAASGCGNLTTGGCSVGTAQTACLNLTTPLAKYLASMPVDPKTGTTGVSGYSAVQDTNGIVTIKACGAEVQTSIQSSR